MKNKKETIIKRVFSREVNSPKLYLLREEFTTEMKINAKGRVHIRAALFLISVMYLTDDSIAYPEVLTLISLLWLTVPAALTIAAPLARKMTEDKYNLYDILAGTGTYIIVAFSLITGELVAVRLISREYPDFFISLNETTGLISLTAAALFIADAVHMHRGRKKR